MLLHTTQTGFPSHFFIIVKHYSTHRVGKGDALQPWKGTNRFQLLVGIESVGRRLATKLF